MAEEPQAKASGPEQAGGEASKEQAPPVGPEGMETPDQEPRQAADPEVVALLQKLEDAQAQAQENWDKFLRTQAELDNLRKRNARDLENAHKYALEKFASELLGVRDSLELGVQAAQESDDIEKIREGTELTLKLLVQLMEKNEIGEIDPRGSKFDPDLHQAMMTQESTEAEPNTVLSVMQKGYRLKDRLLRPALVVVAKAP